MAYNNGANGSNRRNNNPRRNNNNNGSRNGKQNGHSGGRSNGGRQRNFDDENISPQQRRHFVNKRDAHLSKGAEYKASGDRIEAENEFQHAEHYSRMIKIADDQQQRHNDRKFIENTQNSSTDLAESAANFDDSTDAGEPESIATEESDNHQPASESFGSQDANNDGEPKHAEIAALSFMQPV